MLIRVIDIKIHYMLIIVLCVGTNFATDFHTCIFQDFENFFKDKIAKKRYNILYQYTLLDEI